MANLQEGKPSTRQARKMASLQEVQEGKLPRLQACNKARLE
jgi:hypothetical protein